MLKISSFDELSDNLQQMDDGIWRIIGGEWLDEVCMYNNLSSGFLNGQYVASMRLNVTSRKSTICKFVFISILKPMSLKIFVMSFLALSICLPLCSRRSINPSSRYSPVSSFLFCQLTCEVCKSLLICTFQHRHNFHCYVKKS